LSTWGGITIGTVQESLNVPEAERAFSQALDAHARLRGLDVQAIGYLEALSTVVGLCQDAISLSRQHGDAHVLLAHAFYLLHLAIYPVTSNALPLQLAAATIQHWCDQPVGEPPWTKDVDRGCRIYELIARAISEIRPDCADCEEREMRRLEPELYTRALVASPCEWFGA
jgi:hypothetical protein